MIIRCETLGVRWTADLSTGRSIAITQTFNAAQPNHFGVPDASSLPIRAGGFVGSVAAGGSCNVATIQLIPHCNGTHTESVYHILATELPVPAPPVPLWMVARLVSIRPVQGLEHNESYRPPLRANDWVITAQALQAAAQVDAGWGDRTLLHVGSQSNSGGGLPASSELPRGLIVRTLPNDPAKRTTRYGEAIQPCFFTTTATTWIAERFDHLLVDFPSIDRTHDEGLLANHHCFWRVPGGPSPDLHKVAWNRTITEMIFVDDDLADGWYLVNLQIPAWDSDAVPSRPILFPLRPDPGTN